MTTEIAYTPLPPDLGNVRHVHGPDSTRHDDVPAGTVTELTWDACTAYPGTSRRFWVHVPAQYDPTEPASLAVFLDGGAFLDPQDDMRGGVVLDNLVHRGDLPVTIGVFVDAGVADGAGPDARGRNPQRNVEYDASDDRYAAFLLTEIVPAVRARWSVTDDPDRWGICGFSSGGSCAFTVAWSRPDDFRRVVCFSPSFAQMAGGNPYPTLLAQGSRPSMRTFLHVGHRDLGWDEPEDNWLADSLRLAASLAESGADLRLVLGDGGHDSNHAGVLLPDALRWVFRTAGGSVP